jgi:uncharacterized iron-regulated membrane protein
VLGVLGAPDARAVHASVVHAHGQRLPLEELWRSVQALTGPMAETVVTYPRRPDSAVEFLVLEVGAPHGEAWSRVHLDAYSGAVLAFTPYAASHVASKVLARATAIHKGRSGVLAQMLVLAGALAVPFLAWTGVSSYLSRRRAPVVRTDCQ